jgi:hypothetical protein
LVAMIAAAAGAVAVIGLVAMADAAATCAVLGRRRVLSSWGDIGLVAMAAAATCAVLVVGGCSPRWGGHRHISDG